MTWFLIVLAGIAGVFLLWLLPKFQTLDLDPKEANQRFLAENEARKTLAQILGGAAILVGLYFTQQQFELAQAGQVTDRFSKATEQLSSSDPTVRLGALVALERLARDSAQDDWRVMALLSSWVQDQARWKPENAAFKPELPFDVQRALYVIGYRDTGLDKNNDRELDLSGADLRGAYLYDTNFANMFLDNTHFDGADLTKAVLSNASLTGATFKGACLQGADLRAWNDPDEMAAILDGSFGDNTTKLKNGAKRPASWPAKCPL